VFYGAKLEYRDSRAVVRTASVVDVSRPAGDGRTVLQIVGSWGAGAGIALLVPFIMMLIGIPIVLAVFGVVAAVSWLIALLMA